MRRLSNSLQQGFRAQGHPLPAGLCLLFAWFLAVCLPASAQNVDLFPNDPNAWTRVAIPPGHPVNPVTQWHIDSSRHTILCDGDRGHEWLRFNREVRNFTFHVEWRVDKAPGKPKYNSGVFFKNDADGVIWHQAQTTPEGGYLFGETPVDGKLKGFNEQKNMTANRVKPAGKWNAYDIRCVGDTCTLAVNGAVVNTIHIAVDEGYIGLESEGYRIEFRRLKLQQLP